MTEAARLLREEIALAGPIPFSRFMQVALYHPEHGYYRRGRDPFGRAGDYYTAEQIQPVFGILIASLAGELREAQGNPAGFRVVELGAGRGEMAGALAEFDYLAIEAEGPEMPDSFTGVVFANEFFDALPVDVFVRRGRRFRRLLVDAAGEEFRWVEGAEAGEEAAAHLEPALAQVEEGAIVEAGLAALEWIDAIAHRLRSGHLAVIDYGYTAREQSRFPQGTLMSYRSHRASPDVLRDPGERDITAHVAFSALQERARDRLMETERFETLASALLSAGRRDNFAAALSAPSERETMSRRLQLKTLLFGMGETFRFWLARKRAEAGWK